MITVDLHEDETGTAHGPFPAPFINIIMSLSGRKRNWIDGNVTFEASPSNIVKLDESDYDIAWNDPFGLLMKLKMFRSQPTQASAHAVDLGYKPGVSLMKHQIDTLSISRDRSAYAHLHEMGLGKTAIMIAEAGMLHQAGKVSGVLILAPKGVHRQWIKEQIPEHISPDVMYHSTLWTGIPPKKFKREPGLMFYAMNIDAIRTPRGYNSALAFLRMHTGTSMMIIDESHLIKSHGAQRTEAAWKLGALATYRRIATGTPMSKNIIDAWSQFRFLDPMILGHRYITSFRSRYCQMGGFEGKQIIGQKNTEEFHSLIAPHSFRLTKKEALDLPPKLYVTRQYDMSDKTRQHYRELKETFMTEFDSGEIADVPNAAVCLLRLQQIVCGYYPIADGDVEIIGDERLKVMEEIVAQIEGPVVVWARFIEDIKRIEEQLSPYGKVVTYYGATGTAERGEAIKQFLNGEARFFVSNPAAGGTGINLQSSGCQNVIYYSNSFDALHRWQSEDRTHRMGTQGAVTYFDLVATGSVDRIILRNLLNKKSLSGLTFDEIRAAIASDPLENQ